MKKAYVILLFSLLIILGLYERKCETQRVVNKEIIELPENDSINIINEYNLLKIQE